MCVLYIYTTSRVVIFYLFEFRTKRQIHKLYVLLVVRRFGFILLNRIPTGARSDLGISWNDSCILIVVFQKENFI